MNSKRMNRLEELGRVDAEKAKTRMGARNLKDEKKRIVRELKADGGKVKKSEHPLAGREGNVKHRLKSQKQYKAITDTKKYKDASYGEKNKMLAKGGAYTKSAPDKKGRISRADGGSLKPVKPSQKGLKKLPTKVRNKMGYMKKGGRVGMGKAMRGGGCVR